MRLLKSLQSKAKVSLQHLLSSLSQSPCEGCWPPVDPSAYFKWSSVQSCLRNRQHKTTKDISLLISHVPCTRAAATVKQLTAKAVHVSQGDASEAIRSEIREAACTTHCTPYTVRDTKASLHILALTSLARKSAALLLHLLTFRAVAALDHSSAAAAAVHERTTGARLMDGWRRGSSVGGSDA